MYALLYPSLCRLVAIPARGAGIQAELIMPQGATGLVILAHPCGNSRANPVYQRVVNVLVDAGLATLLCDLLTEEEEVLAAITGEFRNDVRLLSQRLVAVLDWCERQDDVRTLRRGVLAVGGATPATLVAAAMKPAAIDAIVCRGGQFDLAWSSLRNVNSPTLVVVGEKDAAQRAALEVSFPMIGSAEKQLLVVPRAGQVFREPTTLDQFAEHAAGWFSTHFAVDQVPQFPDRRDWNGE
jgi:dienelactone hydrolase